VRPDVRAAVRLADGRFAIVGTATGSLFPGALPTLSPSGDGDGFVIAFSSVGAPSDAALLGDATPSTGGPLGGPGQGAFAAVPIGDGLAVSGVFVGAMRDGATDVVATDPDAFVARLDAGLATIGGEVFGGTSTQWGAGLAAAGDGTLRVLLGAYGPVDVAPGAYVGGADALVLPTAP
jgi:hypothetical protein